MHCFLKKKLHANPWRRAMKEFAAAMQKQHKNRHSVWRSLHKFDYCQNKVHCAYACEMMKNLFDTLHRAPSTCDKRPSIMHIENIALVGAPLPMQPATLTIPTSLVPSCCWCTAIGRTATLLTLLIYKIATKLPCTKAHCQQGCSGKDTPCETSNTGFVA